MTDPINKNDPTQNVERAICEQIVTSALARHFRITVHDEEEEVLARSTDRSAIIDSMFGTEMETLVFFAPAPDDTKIGYFSLIYGNDASEVIADHSANDAMAALYADVAGHFPDVMVQS